MYSFEQILARLLDIVPDNVDKRQGSVAYNFLAPVAAEIAQLYINMEIFRDQTFLLTAVGENLDNRGMDHSIQRRGGTPAFRTAMTYDTNGALFNAPIGTRYAIPDMSLAVTFFIQEYRETGLCILVCEQPGAIGNEFFGDLIPTQVVNNLGQITITGIERPGQNEETDDEYRARIIDRLGQSSFGGNIADYKDFVTAIDGVGQVKVFPAWEGGGTVLLSVLDSDFNPITPTFQQFLKDTIDPEEYTGEGVGIAPIGHKVTIETPSGFTIDVTANVILEEGVTPGQIIGEMRQLINQYLYTVKTEWSASNTIFVFGSRMLGYMLQTGGVVSVSNLLLNGQNDVLIQDTVQEQFVPVLGDLTIA